MSIIVNPKWDAVLTVSDHTIVVNFAATPVSENVLSELESLNAYSYLHFSKGQDDILPPFFKEDNNKLSKSTYYVDTTPVVDTTELAESIKETLTTEYALKVNIIFDDFSEGNSELIPVPTK